MEAAGAKVPQGEVAAPQPALRNSALAIQYRTANDLFTSANGLGTGLPLWTSEY